MLSHFCSLSLQVTSTKNEHDLFSDLSLSLSLVAVFSMTIIEKDPKCSDCLSLETSGCKLPAILATRRGVSKYLNFLKGIGYILVKI